jgi:hypothetical protein
MCSPLFSPRTEEKEDFVNQNSLSYFYAKIIPFSIGANYKKLFIITYISRSKLFDKMRIIFYI